jgi:hypothetical protein
MLGMAQRSVVVQYIIVSVTDFFCFAYFCFAYFCFANFCPLFSTADPDGPMAELTVLLKGADSLPSSCWGLSVCM